MSIITLACAGCGVNFEREKTRLRENQVLSFCCRSCHSEYRKKQMEEAQRMCIVCNAPVKSNHTACCSRKCQNIAATKNAQGVCKQCGKKYKTFPSALENGRKFCSDICYRLFSVGENSPQWKGGICLEHGRNWNKIRKMVLNRDKVCQNCGAKNSPSGRKLDIHHIDPRRKYENQDDANVIKNLVALCASCHTKLEVSIAHNSVQSLPIRLKVLALNQ